MYEAEKEIDYTTNEAICSYCTKHIKFNSKPFCLLGGASGIGKNSILQHLLTTKTGFILLVSDVLWRDTYSADPIHLFMNDWLRLL